MTLMVFLSVVTGLDTTNAPMAAPKMHNNSKGWNSAARWPPTPRKLPITDPMTTTQPMTTNMLSPLDFVGLRLNKAVLDLNGKRGGRFRVGRRYLFSRGLINTAKVTLAERVARAEAM